MCLTDAKHIVWIDNSSNYTVARVSIGRSKMPFHITLKYNTPTKVLVASYM